MSSFVLSSWLCFAVTLVLMLTIVYWERWQLVKPSFIFLVFYVVQIQAPSAVRATEIEELIPNPWLYLLLAHIFPLVVLIIGTLWFRHTANVIFKRAIRTSSSPTNSNYTIFLLSLISGAIILFYFYEVPWLTTGLYAIFFNPSETGLAREESLKLLESSFVRYSFAFFSTVLAPILAILLASRIWQQLRLRRLDKTVIPCLLGIIVLLITVSIYGARGPSAFLLFGIFYCLYLGNRFPFRPMKIIGIIFIILTIPALLSILYNRHEINPLNISSAYTNILDRVFNRNIDSHIWTVDFTQRHGVFGVSGVPKIAQLIGKDSIDIFNVIGRYYRPSNPHISATSSFVFGYYSCFGLASFIPCLMLIWLLDCSLLIYRKIGAKLLIPCMGAIAMATAKFTFTFYTTALFSGGFLLVLIFCLLLSVKIRDPKRDNQILPPAIGTTNR